MEKVTKWKKALPGAAAVALAAGGCATISNDPMIPVTFVAPHCEQDLQCTATNKRGQWPFSPPQTVMIRRSDDTLRIQCNAPGGTKTLTHAVTSEMEHGKMGASILLDLGITDSITDKHRKYADQVVIPGCVK